MTPVFSVWQVENREEDSLFLRFAPNNVSKQELLLLDSRLQKSIFQISNIEYYYCIIIMIKNSNIRII